MLEDAYHLILFWIILLVISRCFLSTYSSILLLSVLFGAVEVLKARKTEGIIWKDLIEGINVIGHKGCAMNAPENTIAGWLLIIVAYYGTFCYFRTKAGI